MNPLLALIKNAVQEAKARGYADVVVSAETISPAEFARRLANGEIATDATIVEDDPSHRFRGFPDGSVFELSLAGRVVACTGCPRCVAKDLPEGDYQIHAFRRGDDRRRFAGTINNYGDGLFVCRTANGSVIDSTF